MSSVTEEKQALLAEITHISLEDGDRTTTLLQHASKELQGDRDIVLAAVEKDGDALQYASPELRSDDKVVLVAVAQDTIDHGPNRALQYASKELRSDREFILKAVTENGFALQYASEELRSDQEVVLAAVTNDGMAIQKASPTLKSNRTFILKAVEQAGATLGFASRELKADRKVVLAAVTNDGLAVLYAPTLQRDPEIFWAAVNQNQDVVEFLPETLVRDMVQLYDSERRLSWSKGVLHERLGQDSPLNSKGAFALAPEIAKRVRSYLNAQGKKSKKSKKSTKRKSRRKTTTQTRPKYGLGRHKLVYLEHRKGHSHKFWQGELSRKKDMYFVTYGKIGTQGRGMTKRVGQYSPKRAQEIFQDLVESKLKKGYRFKDKIVY